MHNQRRLARGDESAPDFQRHDALLRTALAVLLVLLGAAATLIDHPWNVTPMGAIALFAAVYLRNPALAIIVPLAALALSDVYKSLADPYWGFGRATLPVVIFKYVGFVAVVLCGRFVRRDRGLTRYIGSLVVAALSGGVVFFLISNFGCWLTPVFGYEQSLRGLVDCYVLGLPFFRDMLLGDLVYGPLLFGALALAEWRFPALAPVRVPGK